MSLEASHQWLPPAPADGEVPTDTDTAVTLFHTLHDGLFDSMREAGCPSEQMPTTVDDIVYQWWRGATIKAGDVALGSVVISRGDDGRGTAIEISITPGDPATRSAGHSSPSTEAHRAPIRYEQPWGQDVTRNGHPVGADHIRRLGSALLGASFPGEKADA